MSGFLAGAGDRADEAIQRLECRLEPTARDPTSSARRLTRRGDQQTLQRMVARVWTGVTRQGESGDRYLAHLRENVLPHLDPMTGYLGAQVFRRVKVNGDEFVVTTFWESVAAIRAFAGPDVEVAVVAPDAKALLIDFAERAVHYEVVESASPGTPGPPQ